MEYTNFKELDAEGDRLWEQNKHNEYLALMEYSMERFPEQYEYAAFNKLAAQLTAENYQDCLKTIQEMHRHGRCCSLAWKKLDPLRTFPEYPQIEAEHSRLVAEARTKAKMEYAVHLPEGYTAQKHYPLFIVLHGDGMGGNNEYQSWYWEPRFMLKHGMIAVYVQSSQVSLPGHHGWLSDYSLARKDILDCYRQITTQYSIDPANIYLGGYSGGAIMSTELVMGNTLPVKGWVGLCPEIKPPSFTKPNLIQALERGVKCVFMEGELNALLPDEQEMVDMFQEVGFPYELYVNKGIGHTFPQDFEDKLDLAISFINGRI